MATTQPMPSGMGSLDDREKGYENKFAHDLELDFKVRARRDRLLARWIAPQTPAPGARAVLAALTMASTASVVMSPSKTSQRAAADVIARPPPPARRHSAA